MIRTPRAFYRMALERLALVAFAVVFTLGVVAAAPVDAKRLALIIGNSDYVSVSKLKNPVNDARAVADKLGGLGFDVTLLQDVNSEDFWIRLDAFSKDAEDAESVLFFYSGHAFQLSGVNYLVPVSAELSSRETIKSQTWSLDNIIARLQARKRQTLIFLDACRNDPLPISVRGTGAAADGLARLQTGVGTFVAFATEPGAVTYDGTATAVNSPFTTAFLNHIETPGISISDMMINVRNEVEQNTLRRQTPWDQSSLREQFYFVPEVETKQELSEADYELLAQLSAEDRGKFLKLLRASGFSKRSLDEAEAAIAVASLNLELAADSNIQIGDAAPAAPAAPAPATTSVAEAAPADTTLPKFEIAGGSDIGPADPFTPDQTADTGTVVRLAALDWETRNVMAINALVVDRMRVTGEQIKPDNDANRKLLASIDPQLIEPEKPGLKPKEIASAAQTELRRLGCYQMRVDGDWGRGSRTALTSYFLAKKTVPDTLEPTPALLSRLRNETRVVCTVRVAKVRVAKKKDTPAKAIAKKKAARKKVEKRIKKNLMTTMGSF